MRNVQAYFRVLPRQAIDDRRQQSAAIASELPIRSSPTVGSAKVSSLIDGLFQLVEHDCHPPHQRTPVHRGFEPLSGSINQRKPDRVQMPLVTVVIEILTRSK